MSDSEMPPPPAVFTDEVTWVKGQPEYPKKEPAAWALGFVTEQDDVITDVFYPPPYGNVGTNYGSFALLWNASRPSDNDAVRYVDLPRMEQDVLPEFDWTKEEPWNQGTHANVTAMEYVLDIVKHAKLKYGRVLRPVLVSVDDLKSDPTFGMLKARLRLTLVSGGHVTLDKINLKKIFTQLPRTAWTNYGVFNGSMQALAAIRREMQRKGKTLKVYLLDKFPMLVDYIDLVDSVRLVGPARLGAYLGPGSVVMPSGFANFGSYVTGPNMIEGRVPIGTTVGAHTDIGGGVSIMGTTSGGNNVPVDIGEYVLLEAMSGLGIPIGDRVRNEVGFYVKATTPIWVNLYDPGWDDNEVIERLRGEHPMASPAGEGAIDFDGVLKVKAIDLAGISDAIFRRDADNGRPSVVPRGDSSWGDLTDYLHAA